MQSEIYSKQYGIGKIFADSWKIFWGKIGLLLLISSVIYVPFSLMTYVFFRLDMAKGLYYVIMGAEGLCGLVAWIAIVYITKYTIDGLTINFAQALIQACRKLPITLGTIIIGIIFLFGMLLLPLLLMFIVNTLPASSSTISRLLTALLYLISFISIMVFMLRYSIYWSFILPAVLLKNTSWKNALNYSKAVVKDRWWRVFGYLLVFCALYLPLIVPYLFSMPTDFVLMSTTIGWTLSSLVNNVIISPFVLVVWTVFFINLDSNRQMTIDTK